MSIRAKMIGLRNDGTLQEMYKHGLISHKPMFYLDIVMELKAKRLTHLALAKRLGVSLNTISRAVKAFKT